MRNIGDKVWVSRFDARAPVHVTCPDCGGTGRIRCIMHDETVVSIDCQNCKRGYENPSGTMIVYQNNIRVELVSIIGFEVDQEKVRYKTDGHYIHGSDQVFDDKDSAIADAEKGQAVWQQEQKDRIYKKEKDTRSWAWNASYHRRQVEDAKRNLEYHTGKLNIAALKKKEEKSA